MTTPKPGIHPGLSYQEYDAIDAVRNSVLLLMRKTPAHAYWKLTHPEDEDDTAALRAGDAFHVATLEPDRFEKQYVRAPKFDKRTNKGKLEAAEWAAAHPTQAPLLPDEWDKAVAMRDAVWKHPIAVELLKAGKQKELTAIWNDPATKLLCKARVDLLTTYGPHTAVVDLKSSRDASPDGFPKSVYDYGYHWQAGFYLDGLSILAPHPRRWLNLVVENTPPWCVIIHEMEPEVIEEGRRQYRRALDLYALCKERGEWPGYQVGIYPLDLPHWAYKLVTPPQ